MRPVNYPDGNPSRDIEDDEDIWDYSHKTCSIIKQEMNDMQKKCYERKTVLEVRDRLCSLANLITICVESLGQSQSHDIKTQVSNVLFFQVLEQLQIADKELSSL